MLCWLRHPTKNETDHRDERGLNGPLLWAVPFVPNSQNPSRSRKLKFSVSANTRKGSGCDSLPVSMHTGQIIMLTKMLTATDLRFYEFEANAPVERWHSGQS